MEEKKPINPNMTLDVKNAEVEQQIKNYLNDKSKENLNIPCSGWAEASNR